MREKKIDLPTGTDLVRDLINSDINITIRKFDRVADKEYTRNGITNYSYDRQGNCVSMIIFYDPNGGSSKYRMTL